MNDQVIIESHGKYVAVDKDTWERIREATLPYQFHGRIPGVVYVNAETDIPYVRCIHTPDAKGDARLDHWTLVPYLKLSEGARIQSLL